MRAAPWIIAAAAALCPAWAGAEPPVRAVAQLDTGRFAGTWYELARLPNEEQAGCDSDVTAHYEPRSDGSFKLTQTCRTPTGRTETEVGVARRASVRDPRDAARWEVSTLPHWLRWLPVGKEERWVVLIDPDYRFAVISEPSRRHLWLLARTPTLPADALGRIVDRLTADGYPTWQLVLTRQSAVVRGIGSGQAVPFTARPRLIVRHSTAPQAA